MLRQVPLRMHLRQTHAQVGLLVALCAGWTTIGRAHGATAVTGVGGAQPGVRLSWVRGPSATDCPDAETIEADTVRRLGHNPFAQRPKQFVEAVATREVESYRVTILMRDGEGRLLGSRVLTSSASDCRALATAAALTIAILIDPDALIRTTPVTPAAPPPAALPSARVETEEGTNKRHRTARAMGTGLVGWGFLPDAALGAGLAATAEIGRYAAAGTILGVFPERRSLIMGGDFAFGLSFAALIGCFAPPGARIRWEICGGGVVSALHVVVYAPLPDDPGQKWSVGATEMGRMVVKLVGSLLLEVGVSATESWPRRAFFIAGRPANADTVFVQPGIALASWIGLGIGWQ